MAKIHEHMSDCRAIIGHCVYKQVHEFLDQYSELFLIELYDAYHRTFLHNRYGIEIVRHRWGDEAAKAAMIHITRDYMCFPVQEWILVENNIGKALMYFNNMALLDPLLSPRVVRAWGGKSLCSIAFDKEGGN